MVSFSKLLIIQRCASARFLLVSLSLLFSLFKYLFLSFFQIINWQSILYTRSTSLFSQFVNFLGILDMLLLWRLNSWAKFTTKISAGKKCVWANKKNKKNRVNFDREFNERSLQRYTSMKIIVIILIHLIQRYWLGLSLSLHPSSTQNKARNNDTYYMSIFIINCYFWSCNAFFSLLLSKMRAHLYEPMWVHWRFCVDWTFPLNRTIQSTIRSDSINIHIHSNCCCCRWWWCIKSQTGSIK